MVDLNFKVKGQKLQLLNRSCRLVNKTNEYIHLNFTFEGADWESNTKYAILNDSKDNSYLFRIYDDEPIIVPSIIVSGNYFIVGAYGVTPSAEDDIRVTTNVYQIRLKGSNYTTELTPIEYETKDVISDLYDKLDLKLNITDYVVDSSLDATSTNPVQNKVIKEALEHVTPTNLARVAYTGDFQDLSNKTHTHVSNDVTDLENTIDNDVDLFCRTLADMIRM